LQNTYGEGKEMQETRSNGVKLEKLYSGKTKDVFLQDDGNVLLYFKDAVTGAEGRIDSGANEVIGEVEGKGNSSLRLTIHFFDLLQKAGIPTHFLGMGPAENTIIVKHARSFNLEVICREKAWGSFVRRYGQYVREGKPLPSLVEFTLKDDKRGDPLITEDALVALDIVSGETVDYMKDTARKATTIIKDHLASRGLELIDIKYEFGEVEGKAIIIDEVSGDSMRVVKDGKVLMQKELALALLEG
jgi:phosphoribosylaminoimidazole-succinocarboxamide synthase